MRQPFNYNIIMFVAREFTPTMTLEYSIIIQKYEYLYPFHPFAVLDVEEMQN